MLILQHTPAGIQSSALDGSSMRISVNQCITVAVQKTHTKNNINSIQFISITISKAISIQVAWAQQLALSNQFGHSYQRHVSLYHRILWVHSCNWRTLHLFVVSFSRSCRHGLFVLRALLQFECAPVSNSSACAGIGHRDWYLSIFMSIIVWGTPVV